MTSKHPKARASLCLILLVAASLRGLSGSQVQKSSEKTCWFCFIRIPNPDPPTMATGFGSHENMAFSMVDNGLVRNASSQEEKARDINYFNY